jgi:hypothetical protein
MRSMSGRKLTAVPGPAYRSILVPLDGSAMRSMQFAHAVALAERPGAAQDGKRENAEGFANPRNKPDVKAPPVGLEPTT